MFVVFKKSAIALAMAGVVVLAGLMAAVGVSGGAETYFGRSDRLVPIYRVDTDVNKVALTFDAAWGCESTEGLLKVLDDNNVPATFFLVQFWVEKYPELVKKMDDQGVEIGTHSATHPHMPRLSQSKIKAELESSMAAIKKVTGKTPTVFRPPFGDYNNTLIETASALNLKTVQWDVDTLDWKDLSANEIATRVLNRAKSGSIILMHNDGKHTLEALPAIIEGLTNKGLGFCTVSDLVYQDNYVIDNAGEQHRVAETAAV